jgi:hypothetical protein
VNESVERERLRVSGRDSSLSIHTSTKKLWILKVIDIIVYSFLLTCACLAIQCLVLDLLLHVHGVDMEHSVDMASPRRCNMERVIKSFNAYCVSIRGLYGGLVCLLQPLLARARSLSKLSARTVLGAGLSRVLCIQDYFLGANS